MPSAVSMPLSEWLNQGTFHLTIQDILDLPVGHSLYLVMFCRNVYDLTDQNPPGHVTNPGTFFSMCYHIKFTKDHDMRGKGEWYNPETLEVEEEDPEWEFHLNYHGRNWFPLINGKLGGQAEHIEDGLWGKDYTEWPTSTRVGWRGPCMRVSDLSLMPDVFNE